MMRHGLAQRPVLVGDFVVQRLRVDKKRVRLARAEIAGSGNNGILRQQVAPAVLEAFAGPGCCGRAIGTWLTGGPETANGKHALLTRLTNVAGFLFVAWVTHACFLGHRH